MVIARADDLAGPGEMRIRKSRNDRRRGLDRAGLVRDMSACRISDQPFIADKKPAIDVVRLKRRDCLFGGIRRDQLLFNDCQIGGDDLTAIVAAERQRQAERLDQHPQAKRRTVQPFDRGDRAVCQDFVVSDEGAVDIRDHQRDFAHRGPVPLAVRTSIPPGDATITAELRPTKRPFSTTPTIELMRRSVSAGSFIGPNRQSRM